MTAPAPAPAHSDPAAGPAAARPATVSVQMPAYNAGRYVAEAVRSILGQTFENFELIVIDDGSTDETPAILGQLAREDPRIRFFSRPNRGILKTRNELLDLGAGEFVAILDADDVAEPNRLERQVAYLRAHPECVAVGSAVLLIDPDGDPLCLRNDDVLTHEQIDAAHIEGSRGAVINQPAAMMRAEAVRALGGFRYEGGAEDLDLYLRLAEVGRLANLPEPLVRYRMVPTGAGHAGKRRQHEATCIILEDARRRRGLPPAPPPRSPSAQALAGLVDPADNHRQWGWWALRGGHPASARKHARALLAARPLSPESWRLLYCALRGR